MLITTSGSSNGYLDKKDIVYTNFDGKSLETGKKPSSEKFLHIGIYNLRPDINFILHVHSPYLSSFASSGRDLMEPIMAENVFYFGGIPLAEYALPSSKKLVDNTVKFFDKTARYTFESASDLDFAYAITVHKSQGSQYDTVLMPVSMATARMLYRNLLYTAISRAGKEVILVGEPRGAEHRDAVHPIPAQIQARRPDQPAAPWAQRVRRRHGEKGVAALSRHRRCRHGPKPPPPAAGEGIQREGAFRA